MAAHLGQMGLENMTIVQAMHNNVQCIGCRSMIERAANELVKRKQCSWHQNLQIKRSSRHRSHTLLITPPKKRRVKATAQQAEEENVLVRAGVAVLTGLLDVTRPRTDAGTQQPRRLSGVQPGDVAGLMQCIRIDYEEHAYFVTGDIWEGVYSEDCFFGDPTVSFTGLQKWRRNLQLLVPFLDGPRIDLLSLKEVQASAQTDRVALRAEWRLTTYLKLPWRPFIDVLGATDYTLNDQLQKVVCHIESWNVSGTEAIMQILKPGRGRIEQSRTVAANR